MVYPRRIPAFCALVLVCSVGAAQVSRIPQGPPRIISTARAVHGLSREAAERRLPIHIRAMITYYDPYIDPRHGAMFVIDASGGVFVRVPRLPILPLRPGMLVDVVGVSGLGDYAAVVEAEGPHIHVVGKSRLPDKAMNVTLSQLLTGSLDCQWVEVKGLIHAARLSPTNVILELATNEGLITAITLRDANENYDSLVDSLIRIQGNAAPVFNRRRQMVGVHLFFPSLAEVKVIQAAPPDPYAVPALSIPSLLQFNPVLELADRVRLQGRVALEWPGRMLCIEQARDGICVQTTQDTKVNLGSLVDVIGFPAMDAFKATLENATFRPLDASAQPPQAIPFTAEQLFTGYHDGELVRIEGELIGKDLAGSDHVLMLRAGRFIFPAIVASDPARPQQLPWEDGSLLRVTGICSVQFDPKTSTFGEGAIQPKSIQLLLRSADDVEVLRTPSWWTPQHALAVIAIVMAMSFAAFAWIVVLRRRVRQQTQALRNSEEQLRHLSYHDALTGLPNRLLLNDRLNMALNRSERFGNGLGLLMVDLDHFKEVNDALGHHAGDQLLCELAKRLTDSTRMTDTVARIGGDEFVILMPDLHEPGEAATIAANIVAAASVPFQLGPVKVPISVSVGVSTFPEGGTDAKTLLQNADAAMYRAKEKGKNGFQVYSPEHESSPSSKASPAFLQK